MTTSTITLADTTLTIGETTTVTFRFNEAVANLASTDINLSNANGTLGSLSSTDGGRTWTATFTPAADVQRDTDNTIRVARSGIDETPSAAYTVDTAKPTITSITIADNKLTAGEATTITITFSEALDQSTFTLRPVVDQNLQDLNLVDANGTQPVVAGSRGTLSNLRTTDGKTWTVTLTAPTTGNTTDNSLAVVLDTLTDLAGNSGGGGNINGRTVGGAHLMRNFYSIDTTRPTLTSASISYAAGETDTILKAGETATVRFVFSEEVTGFGIDDITLSNATGGGTLSGLTLDTTDTTRKTWIATLTAPTTSTGSTNNTLSVNLAGINDLAGNAGTGTTTTTISYGVDTRRPTATITLADTALTVGETTTVTFTFSKPVNGFTADDILLPYTNDTLSALTANAERTVWTATYTPAANVSSRINTVRVNTTGITDDAGNTGTSMATSANYIIDTTRPTATITLADTTLTVGETTTVTFTFSEPVTGFTTDDIVLTNANGTLGTLTANADRTVWTATFTPTANIEDATNTISVNMTGVSDNAGNTGSGEQSSGNYVIDTHAPVLAGAVVNGNQLVLSYTEANSLDAAALAGNGGFTVTNGGGTAIGVTSVSVDPAGKTVTLTLGQSVTSQDTVTVSYTKPATGNVVQDAAGNDAANFTGQAVTNNTPAPPVPVDPVAPVAPDTDQDHVPNAEEDKAIGPNGEVGDGNGDGIQDSTQAAVGSISVTTSSSTNSSVTLVASSQDGKVSPDSNVSITRLEQKETPANLPRGLEMPIGLVQFQTTLASAGSSEKFSLYVDPALGSNGYWVQDHTGTWVNLASEPCGGKMVDEGGRLRLDFQITDGGQFDADGKADGVITAPGAVAHMPLSIVGQAPDTEHGGFWF